MDLSIIIPVYNSEKHIKTTLGSILPQLRENVELIVIDDGSTDSSYDIISQLCENEKNIIYERKENGGVSSARNQGVNIASGNYIAFLDSDDTYNPGAIDIFLNEIKSECDLYVFSYFFSQNEKRTVKVCTCHGEYPEYDELCQWKNDYILNPIWNKLYKRSCIKEGFDSTLSMGEDLLFNLSFLRTAKKVVASTKTVMTYSHRKGSLSYRKDNSRVAIQLLLADRFDSFLQDLYPTHYHDIKTLSLCSLEKLYNEALRRAYFSEENSNKRIESFKAIYEQVMSSVIFSKYGDFKTNGFLSQLPEKLFENFDRKNKVNRLLRICASKIGVLGQR